MTLKKIDGCIQHGDLKIPVGKSRYEKFVAENFSVIQSEFKKIGYIVDGPEDFHHLKGWNKQCRRIKRGSRSLKVSSPNTTGNYVYKNGAPVLDSDGNPIIRSYAIAYDLFHRDQTREM